ncbi:hypothetical protein [Streptomyces californicus]
MHQLSVRARPVHQTLQAIRDELELPLGHYLPRDAQAIRELRVRQPSARAKAIRDLNTND